MIFLVLALLWGAIEIMHAVLGGKKEKKKASQPTKAETSAPAADTSVAVPTVVSDDGAVIAAITAAITAARAETGDTSAFRVVSFQRAAKRNARRGF